jgi:RNA polymerase sigma factor (sigma-70 family)
MEDGILAGMVTEGDEAAFEELYERHRRGVLALCRHLLGSHEEAEDALQHTFGVAFRELAGARRPAHPRPWIYAIARNRCLTVLRHRRELPSERSTSSCGEPSDEVEQRADLRELMGDIGRLPEEQRAALILSELGELQHAEVAQVLGCERDKVRALVFQARSTLSGWRAARERSCLEVREHIAVGRGAELRRGILRRHLQVCDHCAAFQERVVRQRRKAAPRPLTRRHPQRPVEAQHFPVQHRVLGDVAGQPGVLLGSP